MQEVQYLGIRIGSDGVRPDPELMKSVLKAKRPTNQREVRVFVGAVMFYGRFIQNLSVKAQPLNALPKKGIQMGMGREM